jgi:hypothetical protein
LAAPKKPLLVVPLLVAALLLGGCGAWDEARAAGAHAEWERFKAGPWPWQQPTRRLADPASCQLLPLEYRTTVQEGVNDQANYTQCWQAPYYASGMRMGNRPE